jgi:hypothetical protein
VNEKDEWWVEFLADLTAEARRQSKREFRSEEKQQIFMDAFHWTMLQARVEFFDKVHFED